jgi:membrane protease YdiL (CAAX protease family)
VGRARAGSLVAFFLLTFAVMWTLWFTLVAASIPVGTPLGGLLIYLGAWSPSIVALALTARAEGAAGVRALVGRVVQWDVPAKWYVFAVGYFLAIELVAAAIHRVAVAAWPRFGAESLYLIPLAIAFSTPFQAGEEIGWRGYALPRMAARFGLARSSLLLGLIWAFWHLPQFFIRDGDSYGQSFFVFVALVTALTVAMAWLYGHTGGSLLPVMVMHAAVNNAGGIVPIAAPGGTSTFGLSASSTSLVGWLTLALLWIGAAWFLARMPAWNPRPATSR